MDWWGKLDFDDVHLRAAVQCAAVNLDGRPRRVSPLHHRSHRRLGSCFCRLRRRDARAQWAELDRRIAGFDAEFVRWAKEHEDARRLTSIPGFGALVASALVAAVGRAESFERGRDLAAWLGLVPRQFTTGGKPKLLGISKRGDKYLRRQLVHGARAALPYVAERDTPARPMGKRAAGTRPSQCLLSSPSPTNLPGSPGRCRGDNRGSPQNRPWRRRIRAFGTQSIRTPTGFARGYDEMA
jgi:transposase